MRHKKIAYQVISLLNWCIVALGMLIILAYITPLFDFLAQKDFFLFFLSFVTLVLIGVEITLTGICGVIYKDMITPDVKALIHLYTPDEPQRTRGRKAVQLGANYIILGILLICGLVYAMWSTAVAREQLRLKNQQQRQNQLQQTIDQLDDQPPHFSSPY